MPLYFSRCFNFSFCLNSVSDGGRLFGLFWKYVMFFVGCFWGWIKLGLEYKSSCSYICSQNRSELQNPFRNDEGSIKKHELLRFPRCRNMQQPAPCKKKNKKKTGVGTGRMQKDHVRRRQEPHSLWSKDETWTFIGQMIYTPCGSSLIFRYSQWGVKETLGSCTRLYTENPLDYFQPRDFPRHMLSSLQLFLLER